MGARQACVWSGNKKLRHSRGSCTLQHNLQKLCMVPALALTHSVLARAETVFQLVVGSALRTCSASALKGLPGRRCSWTSCVCTAAAS